MIELRNKYVIDDFDKFIHEYYPTKVDWIGPGTYYGKYEEQRAGCNCCYEQVLVLINQKEYKQELIEYLGKIYKEIDELGE